MRVWLRPACRGGGVARFDGPRSRWSGRQARAVSATMRSCRNGEESSAVLVEPNMARFAGVSARVTSNSSAAPTSILATSTVDGASSPASGPAAWQRMPSIGPPGTGSRHCVITFSVGTWHSRVNGMFREQPCNARKGLAVRRGRHQGHCEHQPDHQRVRNDPPPLPQRRHENRHGLSPWCWV